MLYPIVYPSRPSFHSTSRNLESHGKKAERGWNLELLKIIACGACNRKSLNTNFFSLRDYGRGWRKGEGHMVKCHLLCHFIEQETDEVAGMLAPCRTRRKFLSAIEAMPSRKSCLLSAGHKNRTAAMIWISFLELCLCFLFTSEMILFDISGSLSLDCFLIHCLLFGFLPPFFFVLAYERAIRSYMSRTQAF